MPGTIGRDDGNAVIQAAYGPLSGATVTITTAAAATAKHAALLAVGLYRVSSSVAVTISFGVFASVVATATDMPLAANGVEYFMVVQGDGIAAFDAGAGGGTVSITKMREV